MADVRKLLRSEQASRRISHPNLSYTKSGLLNCLVCNLIIKSESLWEGHLRSANHKKNVQKAQNGDLQDVNGAASKKRKMSDETEDVRKKRKSTGIEQEDVWQSTAQPPEEEVEPSADNAHEDLAVGPPTPEDETASSVPEPPPTETAVLTLPPLSARQPQIDEDEWAAFEREVVPLAHQNGPADYASATISAAPVSAAELAAQTNAEHQQRRDAEAEDEKVEEETRLMEEFEVMEGLEERVKRLREKREALRTSTVGDGVGIVEGGSQEKPPSPPSLPPPPALDEEEDESDDDDDDWGFA